MTSSERQLEEDLIAKLTELKYSYREDIRDRASLESDFRDRFQELNRVKLTGAEFEPAPDHTQQRHVDHSLNLLPIY